MADSAIVPPDEFDETKSTSKNASGKNGQGCSDQLASGGHDEGGIVAVDMVGGGKPLRYVMLLSCS